MLRGRYLAAGVLALVAGGPYLGSLSNGFVFDDVPQVVDNPWIRDVRRLPEAFTHDVWAFADRDSNYYRPLMHVVYAAAYAPLGPAPGVFHAVNLLLHVAMTLAVFVLILRLVPDPGDRTGALPVGALLASLVFAAHPIHVEAVAWIGGLPEVACGTFFLAALLALEAARRHGARSGLLHAAGAACFLVAALFKEIGATLPAVVAALDLARRHERHDTSWWTLRYGGLAAAGLVYTVLRLNALDGIAPHASESRIALGEALDLSGVAIWRYFAMLVFPYPLNSFQTLESATGLPSWISLLGFPLGAVVAIRRRSVAWTAALTLFLVPLIPALGAAALLPGLDNPWAERYVYLPSVGFVVALALGLRAVGGARRLGRRVAVATALAVVLTFSGMTIARVAVWRDDLTLWRDATSRSPNAGAAHGALGHALFVRGDIEGAISEYEAGIRLEPDHADSHLNLGVALAVKGAHEAALGPYAGAIRLQPRRAIAHADLAISLSMLGRHAEAIAEARRAVDLRPGLAKAYHALGVALGNTGRVAEAALEFRLAIELDPADALSRRNLENAEKLLRDR